MKKIAFITPSYFPSVLTGSGVVVMKLAEQFVQSGYEVSVITSNALTTRYWYDPIFGKKIKKSFEVHHGVKIYRLPCFQLYSSMCFIVIKTLGKIIPSYVTDKLVIQAAGPYLIGLETLVQSKNFDVIHCSPSPLAINIQTVNMLKKLKKRPKLILTPFFHVEIDDFTNPELQKIFSMADKVHTITQGEKNIIQKRFTIDKKKITVVPLFLDMEGMHTVKTLKNDIALFKKKNHLQKKKVILFAGIKGYGKGAPSLLSAIDILYKKNSEYIVIAMGTNTPEWKQEKKRVDPHCFLDLEYKTGKEKEIIFGACDIFCMPSKSESFGMVYLEAWAKQKPVIAAITPAVTEFLGKNAIFTEFDNSKGIAKAIEKLSEDKITQKKLGENGYNTLMEKYTFKKVFPKYIQLFTQKFI